MGNRYFIPHFTYGELACPATNKIVLAKGFADNLVNLREHFNKPMPLTSACRSKEYNRKIGGHYRSLHVYDFPAHPTGGNSAVDVKMTNGSTKGDLVCLAWQLGWSVGIHRDFLHLDRRSDYTQLPQAIFTY